ncbi:AI-2E family transporter [Roseomonas sp. BN140053]|uniref:AI-2E family transporter n=1 Tax=Roseomonas sp. BN140053 TaxID=3391898 RepID=UPI0039EA8E46
MPRFPDASRRTPMPFPVSLRRVKLNSQVHVSPAGVPGSGFGVLYAAAAVVAVLYFARELLVPLVLAALLCFVLAPAVRQLRRVHVPRVAAVLVTAALAFGLLAAIGLVMGKQMAELAMELPRYQATVSRKIDDLTGGSGMVGRFANLLHDLGQSLSQREQPEALPALPANEARPFPVEVRQPDPGTLELLQRVIEPLLGPVAKLGIVIVFVIFLLLYREDMRDRLIKLMGSRDLQRTTAALDDAADRLSRYFLAQTVVNTGFGLGITLGLWLIGIPSPLLWGILAGLMRFVPFVGGFIAAAFPILLAMAVDPGWTTLLWTLALFLVAEPLMGNAVEPMIYGHSTGLSPVAVLLATAFWAWLWGPLGMLLATPLTVGLVVLGRHVDQLEFLDVMLGDREALKPPEAFYQRALAGDGDGLTEQAETQLRAAPLAAYYDEVALPGLALAQADAARDALDQARMDAVRERVDNLLDELSEHEDVAEPVLGEGPVAPEPGDPSEMRGVAAPPVGPAPSWQQPGAVLCLAGRGRFDAQAAAMLAQVLAQHGLGTAVLPNEALRDPALATRGGAAVRGVCLSLLEGGSSAASARYALRRLRRRFPGAVLMVGAWGGDRGGPLLSALCDGEAPDHCVTSLRDAAEAWLTTARADAPQPAPAPAPEPVPEPRSTLPDAGSAWSPA